ncbi:MAG: hypothetical protein RL415_594, partial [Actinomycetota bacterium]
CNLLKHGIGFLMLVHDLLCLAQGGDGTVDVRWQGLLHVRNNLAIVGHTDQDHISLDPGAQLGNLKGDNTLGAIVAVQVLIGQRERKVGLVGG